MTIMLQDRAPLERVRKLADGRLTAVVRFARSGVYQYRGTEVGRPELPTVNVFRPDSEVFAEDAMASFAHKAITLGHPSESVTATNWSRVSVGFTEGRIARDGGYLEIPLMLADAAAVAAYESGRMRELSAGYACDVDMADGATPDGQRYQAVQRNIRGNHIALVPAGRAGSACRIGDTAMSIIITDAQITDYLASPEGVRATSYAKYKHALSGRQAAEPWTTAHDHAVAQAAFADGTAWSERVRNLARDHRNLD